MKLNDVVWTQIDIYHLPSLRRLHAAVTKDAYETIATPDQKDTRSAMVMGIHLSFVARGAEYDDTDDILQLVVAFEDGRVECWESRTWWNSSDPRMDPRTDGRPGPKAGVWECRWREKVHNEASQSSWRVFLLFSSHSLVDTFLSQSWHLRFRQHSTTHSQCPQITCWLGIL